MTMEFDQRAEFTRELPVALNDHELQTYGRMLAEKVREEELTEEKKKSVVKEWSTKIGIIRQDIKRIADARAKGEELRPVRCAERLHGNVIEIVRLDRNEVVDTRPADLRDLQTSIPGTDEPPERPGVVLQFVPPSPDQAEPPGFDEGPRGSDIGPSDGDHAEPAVLSGDDRVADAIEQLDGTGIVYDGDTKIGEVVETSGGGAAFISESTQCPACGVPIDGDDETLVDEGMVVHKACASSDALVNAVPAGELPSPTFSATIGENVDAKKPAKKRERSSKKNSEKK